MMMKQLQRNLIYFVLLVIKKQTKINKHQPTKGSDCSRLFTEDATSFTKM